MRNPFRSNQQQTPSHDNGVRPNEDPVAQVIAASDVLLHARNPTALQTATAVQHLITIAEQQPAHRNIAQSGLQAYLRTPAAVHEHTPATGTGPRMRTLTPAAETALDHLIADPRLLHPNLRGVDWSDVDLAGHSLRGADLSAANLDHATLLAGSPGTRPDLTRVRLVGASLQGVRANGAQLLEADLTGADLSGAVLADAQLDRVTATRADFTGADLTGVHSVQAQLRGANLHGANLQRATLVLADLQRADLGDANLHYADLTGSPLTPEQVVGAEFAAAQLQGTGLDGSFLPPAVRDKVALYGAQEIPDQLDRTWIADRAPNLLHNLDTAANLDQLMTAREQLSQWAYHYGQSTYMYDLGPGATSPDDALADALEANASIRATGVASPEPDPWLAAPSAAGWPTPERAPDFWRFPNTLDQTVATAQNRTTSPTTQPTPQINHDPTLGQSELGG